MTPETRRLQGCMQHHPLRVTDILDHAAVAHPAREIVSRQVDEPDWRGGYSDLALRAARAANALRSLGTVPGDRIATLAWNNVRHLELFYAVPGIGAVLVTANPRLFDDQIVYTLNHSEARCLLFDRNLLELVERIAPRLETIVHFVMLSDAARHTPGSVSALCYEDMVAQHPTTANWFAGEETDAAVLCYTSGTTGDPKGVLYSHRSIVLHAMAASATGAFATSVFDVIMPCSSLYHATGWALPYIAPMQGAKIVLPGDRLTPENMADLIRAEGVTFSVGVPTIWTAYLDYVERTGTDVASLRKIVIGGAAVPRLLAERLKSRGVSVLQLWGMTELSPLGTASTSTPETADMGDEEGPYLWSRQGRIPFGIKLRIAGEQGEALPWDGSSAGAIMVKGPWVAAGYYRAENKAIDSDGWFNTGDIGTIDRLGYLRLTDRAKDVIKSGGEWISSIDVENIAVSCAGVKLAAVVGVPHPKWDERPILIIEAHDDAKLDEKALLDHLRPQMAKWWLPDMIIFDAIPLTSTGKIDKKLLRLRYADVLEVETPPGPSSISSSD